MPRQKITILDVLLGNAQSMIILIPMVSKIHSHPSNDDYNHKQYCDRGSILIYLLGYFYYFFWVDFNFLKQVNLPWIINKFLVSTAKYNLELDNN